MLVRLFQQAAISWGFAMGQVQQNVAMLKQPYKHEATRALSPRPPRFFRAIQTDPLEAYGLYGLAAAAMIWFSVGMSFSSRAVALKDLM